MDSINRCLVGIRIVLEPLNPERSHPPDGGCPVLDRPGTPGKNYSSLRSSSVAEVGGAHYP